MFYTQGSIYYICFAVSLVVFSVFLVYILRKFKDKSDEEKLKPIKWIFFILITLEIVKIFILIGNTQLFEPYRFPIAFCSIAMYTYPLFCFKQNRFSDVAKAISIIPSLIAFASFVILPGTLLRDDATGIFVTCHSFFYHFALGAIAIYILATKIYVFEYKKFYSTFLALAAYVVLAVAISLFIGGNISLFGPDSAYLKFLYDLVGYIPGNLLIIIFGFILSMSVYKLIDVCKKKAIAN